jgi:hypothetical protein
MLKTFQKAKVLAEYIKNLPSFIIVDEIDGNYHNMGAVIIDGILQAGIKYETTVRPRVKKYLTDHPQITTTKQFAELISKVPVSKLINWKPSAKTQRIEKLTEFLVSKGINAEAEFKLWLASPLNINEIKKTPRHWG